MLRYLLRRLLLAVPTLLVISLFTFGLSKYAPYDPVYATNGEDLASGLDPEAMGISYQRLAAQLNLDVPDFYWTLTTAIFPDTLNRIYPPERREKLKNLTAVSANWPGVSRYENTLVQAVRATERLPASLPQKAYLQGYIRDLLYQDDPMAIDTLILGAKRIIGQSDSLPGVSAAFDSLHSCNNSLKVPTGTIKRWVPTIYWHGTNNQYHRWLSGFITGNLGLSASGRAVSQELRPGLFTTLTINGLAILLSFLLAIPLGVAMAKRKAQSFDRWTSGLLLLLYSLPVFWLGSLLMFALATPDHGLHLIKSLYADPWNSRTSTFLHYVGRNASKFVLPVLSISLHLIAILAIQMRSGMLNVMNEDYIRTARAKGLPENLVYWRHAFRNALFPMITLFAGLIPLAFTGSLVVEYLFQFPGIGMKTQEAFISRDYPVLFAILMLAAFITILGRLLGDMLYAWADPRVRFTRK